MNPLTRLDQMLHTVETLFHTPPRARATAVDEATPSPTSPEDTAGEGTANHTSSQTSPSLENAAQNRRLRRLELANNATSRELFHAPRLNPTARITSLISPLILPESAFPAPGRITVTLSGEALSQLEELLTLSRLLNSNRLSPKKKHLLYVPEIFEFALCLVDEMKAVKDEFHASKLFTKDEIESLSEEVVESIHRVGLLRFLQSVELREQNSVYTFLLKRNANDKIITTTLSSQEEYKVLFDKLVKVKQLLTLLCKKALTKETVTPLEEKETRLLLLEQNLLHKKEPSEIQEKALEDKKEKEAFQELVDLKMAIDRNIINSYDPDTKDHELPVEQQVPWGSVFICEEPRTK
jgi:hypothetical protein